jgi:hypothetical protein
MKNLKLKVFGIISFVGVITSGCAIIEHKDGGGFTTRYVSALTIDPMTGQPVTPKTTTQPVVPPKSSIKPAPIIAYVKPSQETMTIKSGPSHPALLNIGKDDEIPKEYAHFVSDRNLTTLRARSRMCKEQRSAYCNEPNIAHCHGPFCHAHIGGDKRHTHAIGTNDRE